MKVFVCLNVKKRFSVLIFTLILTSCFQLYAEDSSVLQANVESSYFEQAEAFMMEYTVFEDKTMNRLVLLHKDSNIKKLGKEQIDGLVSGTLFYQTKVQGLSGLVTMIWTNFCEDEGWIFDGTMYTKANISGSGKLSGHIKVSGKYNATVYLDNITIEDNLTAGGTYGVELGDNPRVEIPYQVFYKAKGLPVPSKNN
ncbi:MAG: hypothetical protein K6A43_12355 [Treponema sp.]|nr:hypothetical protein [Treponema sp.]